MVLFCLLDVLRINIDMFMLYVLFVDQVIGDSRYLFLGLFTPWHVFVPHEHLFCDIVLGPWLRLLWVHDVLHNVIWDVLFYVVGVCRSNQK